MAEKDDIRKDAPACYTRRDVIRGALAGAAGAAALGSVSCSGDDIYSATYPEVPENNVSLPENGKSVLILGGGFGGMHLACDLLDRGFKVTVIEKSGFLGGKLKSWRDRDFGSRPPGSADWPGYPRDHGMHAVWGSYNNLREFMGRHRYRLYEFPPVSTIYNYITRDGLEFQLGEKPGLPGPLGRVESLFQVNSELGKIAGDDMDRMRKALLKMASFDFYDEKQRMYLDGVSFPEWARSVGMPEEAIYKLFGANAEMSNMDHVDNTSALATLSLSATVSGNPEDMRVDMFTHPAGETYVAPIEKYIIERGGEILYNTTVARLRKEGGRIKSVFVGDEGAPEGAGTTWRCEVCGSVFGSAGRPHRCPVCGAGEDRIMSSARTRPAEYTADYYVLAMEIPGAREVIFRSELSGDPYFDNIMDLTETGVYTVNLWYPDKGPWKKRFPYHANFFASGFKYLGITMDLAHDATIKGKKVGEPLMPEYADMGVLLVETQIPNAEELAGESDDRIAKLVHEELKIIMPDLPRPKDFLVNRWETYSPQRVGYEALRPSIQSPFDNLLLSADWVRTDHLSAYMEKTYVASKMAANLILEKAGQRRGKMEIFESGTPSTMIWAIRKLFSVYP